MALAIKEMKCKIEEKILNNIPDDMQEPIIILDYIITLY